MALRRVSGLLAAASLGGMVAGSVVVVVATAALAWATAWIRTESGAEDGFDVWLGRVAACGAWLAILWLTVGFTVAIVAAMRTSAGDSWDRLAIRVAPAGVRRLAQLVAGTVLMSGTVTATAGPAVAGSLSPPTPAVTALPDLDRPFIPGKPAPAEVGLPFLPAASIAQSNPQCKLQETAVFRCSAGMSIRRIMWN